MVVSVDVLGGGTTDRQSGQGNRKAVAAWLRCILAKPWPAVGNVSPIVRRNDRCWCGLPYKYKHCHGDPRRELANNFPGHPELIRKNDIARQQAHKYARAQKYECMFPSCKSFAQKRSHAQQKEGQLRAIAREGKVYFRRRDFPANSIVAGKPEQMFKLLGLRDTSVFPGFCPSHDGCLFEPIEIAALEPSRYDHGVLLGLRALTWEYAQRREAKVFGEQLAELTKSYANRKLWDEFLAMQTQFRVAVERNLPHWLASYWATRSDCSEGGVNVCWRVINRNIGVSTACAIDPTFGRYAEAELTRGDPPPVATFSICPEKERTHFVATWPRDVASTAQWVVQRMLDDVRFQSMVNWLAFTATEDLAISPDLWESLSSECQREVGEALFMRSSAFDPTNLAIPDVIQISANDLEPCNVLPKA